ncbi:MAG: preprotein translocase subunit YajC [Pseudomonadota bacterium]
MSATPVLAAAAPSGGAGSFIIQLVPLILIFVIFWFLLIRPQQKRMKDHRAMIDAVKRGDRVVTGGGLLGKVTKVNDDEVEVDLGGGQKVTALKATLSDVRNPNAAND